MEMISNHRCIIGEGPIWNELENKLYQVNGYGPNEILIIDIYSGERAIKKLDFGVVTATLGTDLETDKNAGYTFICDIKSNGRKPYLFEG